ncbi:MAG: hypothetical protein ACTSVZ_01500 [Promethearchaeota archaeon]
MLSERNLIEAGYKIISTGDDLGQKQRALISPKIYEEFLNVETVVQSIAKYGKYPLNWL